MKLIKKITLFILLLFINLTIVNAEVTIDQVVSGLNNNIKSINVTYDNDSINIDATEMLNGFSCEFELNGNIISSTYDPMNSESIYKHTFFTFLVNEISKLHGYDEYELFLTINSKQSDGYSLEKDGLKKEKSGYVTSYQIDFTKKIPLVDYSNSYIKETDLAEYTKYYKEGVSLTFNAMVENLFVWVNTDASKLEVVIGETKGVTQSSYKSLKTVLSIMFGNKKINSYFEDNIKDLSKDSKIDGIEIYVDDEQVKNNYAQYEEFKTIGFDFTYIKIDRGALKNAAESYVPVTENKEEKEEQKEEQKTEEKEEQESNEVVYQQVLDPKILLIPAAVVVLLAILIIVAYLKNEKKKEIIVVPTPQTVEQPIQPVEQLQPVEQQPQVPVTPQPVAQPVVQPATLDIEQPPSNNGNNL